MASTLMTMRKQLLGWFLLVGLLPLLLLAVGLQWHLERTLVAENEIQLYSMAREKGHLVRERALAVKGQAEQAAALPMLARLLAGSQDQDDQQLSMIAEFSHRFTVLNNHYDMLLVNTAGKVIFTVMGESDYGADLTSDDWKNTAAGEAFDQAKSLMTTVITPFRWYEPSQRRAAFVATPVWDKAGMLVGVMLVQLNDNWLASIAASQIGLSATGEIVLVQQNASGKLVAAAPLRFYPSAAQDSFLLEDHQDTPSKRAMRGDEGWGEGVDYRGVPVVAGRVHIPALQMGLVVKQDSQEVFAPLVSQRYVISVIFMVLLLFVGVAMWVASQRFVAPIQDVARIAASLAQGRWHLRLPETEYPNIEIAQLTIGFNQLAQTVESQLDKLQQQTTVLEEQASELESYARNLEDLVGERTQALERLSLVDPMTGLFNRRHYMNEAPKSWRQAARSQQLLLFIMLDVDKFKEYNDTQGHQAGDNALVRVAHVLQDTCQRSSDIVFRMGGEEMAVLSLVKDVQEVDAIAQRILVSVQMCAIAHPASTVLPVLTVSLGLALFDGSACDAPTEPNIDKLYALADAALYQAKSTGRNRAVIASEKITC
jgi:diguanylate cyclase (GGDEF)-like protein